MNNVLNDQPDYPKIIFEKLHDWELSHPKEKYLKYEIVSDYVKSLPVGAKIDFLLPEFKDHKQSPLIHQGYGIFTCLVDGDKKTVTVPNILPFIEDYFMEQLNHDLDHDGALEVMAKYMPETREELKDLCDDLSVNLGDIDTSKITDMSKLFFGSKRIDFSGIENWDVSNVRDMSLMFEYSMFNGDISKWDVSNVTDMFGMFISSGFNGDISQWDVSNVKDMSVMFWNSAFNRDISKWDVSNVEYMIKIFDKCSITADKVPEKFKSLVQQEQQEVKKGRSR